MKKNMLPFLLFLLLAAVPAQAFMQEGCGAGKCSDCHSLTEKEAAALFKGNVDRVLKVELDGGRIVLSKHVDDAISRVRGKFALDAGGKGKPA